MVYDYIIIGAGPSGLTLAYLMGRLNKRCLLVDKAPTVGGCHRVFRVANNNQNLMTEHSPRIYSTSFVNLIQLLKLMGTDFDKLFTPSKFSIGSIGGKSIGNFTFREMFLLAIQTAKMGYSDESKNLTVYDYVTRNKFTAQAIDYMDRICRLSDGTDMYNYTLYEFIQIINQQMMYVLHQPIQPNDKGLFKIWVDNINQTGMVDILLDSEVDQLIHSNGSNMISGIRLSNGKTYMSTRVILAIPPLNMYQLLDKSLMPNIFNPNMKTWVMQNSYQNHVSCMFYWNEKIKLPDVWGFPSSEWGVVFIVLSDYIKFEPDEPQTVITIGVSKPYVISSVTGKTAHQTGEIELYDEIFRQLKLSFGDIPKYDTAIINPLVKRVGSLYVDSDTAYVRSIYDDTVLPYDSLQYPNIYNAGTQNGYSSYSFTSMESAVANAICVGAQLEPGINQIIRVRGLTTLLDYVFLIMVIIVILVMSLLIPKIAGAFRSKKN